MLLLRNFYILSACKHASILWCVSIRKVIYSAFGNVKKNTKNINILAPAVDRVINYRRFRCDLYPCSFSWCILEKPQILDMIAGFGEMSTNSEMQITCERYIPDLWDGRIISLLSVESLWEHFTTTKGASNFNSFIAPIWYEDEGCT